MELHIGNAKVRRSFFNANSAGGARIAANQAAFNRKQALGIEFTAGRPEFKSREGTISQRQVALLEIQEKTVGLCYDSVSWDSTVVGGPSDVPISAPSLGAVTAPSQRQNKSRTFLKGNYFVHCNETTETQGMTLTCSFLEAS